MNRMLFCLLCVKSSCDNADSSDFLVMHMNTTCGFNFIFVSERTISSYKWFVYIEICYHFAIYTVVRFLIVSFV